MWTAAHRRQYDRTNLRYPSDLTDVEWALAAPLIPPAKRGGRRRTVEVREVLNGIFYLLSTGCQWRALPKDLPPRSTVHGYLQLWAWDGTLARLHHALYVQARERAGKEASPTVAILDSQSVRSAEKGGRAAIRRAEPVLGPAAGRTRGTRARRSRGASGTSWSTRSVCC